MEVSESGCNTASIDASGHIRKYPAEEQEFHNYYLLECLMQGNIDIFEYDIPYPEALYLYPSNQKHIETVNEIIARANEANIKMLEVSSNRINGSRYVVYIAFIKDSERINALLLKYIVSELGLKSSMEGKVTWVAYAFGVIFHYPEADIRGFYLREYLLYCPPVKYEKHFRELERDPYIGVDESFEIRRKYVEELDDFAEFNQQFQEFKREALKNLKDISRSAKFKAFAKRESKTIFRYNGQVPS